MLIRYISVLSKINDNKNAKTLLNHIMMDKINDQLSNVIVNEIEGEENTDNTAKDSP
jgi:hypothetical protein